MNIRRLCRGALEPGLLVAVVFAPWAFGSAFAWSAMTLTVLGMGIGLLAVIAGTGRDEPRRPLHRAFGIAWVAFLAYVLISAVNARATAEISDGGVSLIYRECLRWLPHSYDAPRAWMALAKHLAVAGLFLAVWRLATASMAEEQDGSGRDWPRWLVRLLWVLSISSAVLALVSIAQRLSGTNRLLFLIPRVLPGGAINGVSSFGPYPYQANGAQYFNLLWPLTLGFWWCQHQQILERTGVRPRYGSSPLTLLPFAAALMIACAFLSNSRGGALVCMAQLGGVLLVVVARGRTIPRHIRFGLIGGIAIALAIAAGGWSRLWQRFEQLNDGMSGRAAIYVQARQMAAEFQPWGSGGDSFRRLSDLYSDPEQLKWEAFVHNDWLEAYLSYGAVGSVLLGLIALLGVLAWIRGPWLEISSIFAPFALLSLGGLLLHARFDLPFQILSLHALFAVVAALALASPLPWRRDGSSRRRVRRSRRHSASEVKVRGAN